MSVCGGVGLSRVYPGCTPPLASLHFVDILFLLVVILCLCGLFVCPFVDVLFLFEVIFVSSCVLYSHYVSLCHHFVILI